MSPSNAPRGFRQARCDGCGLPPRLCLCSAFPPLRSRVEVSVVLPRAERRKSSGTARLLALWLAPVRLVVVGTGGTANDPALLAAAASAAVLFPEAPTTQGDERPATRQVLPGDIQHLIVPDGTWRQARRIERRWFRASGLPRVALDAHWPSAYGLRRRPEGLCTFESTAIAIGLFDSRRLGALLLERFAEWQRRAWLVRRGGDATAHDDKPATPASHPALDRLRDVPPPR